MKNFNISTFNANKHSLIVLLFLFTSFALISLCAYFTQNILITIIVAIITITTSIITSKRMMKIKPQHIETSDDGFIIDSAIEIKWNELLWYKIDDQAAKSESLSFKLKSGKKITFTYYMSPNNEDDWNEFKTYFLDMIKSNEIDNYFINNKWINLTYVFYASYLIIPLLIWLSGLNFSKALFPFLMYISTTAIVIARIYQNKSNK